MPRQQAICTRFLMIMILIGNAACSQSDDVPDETVSAQTSDDQVSVDHPEDDVGSNSPPVTDAIIHRDNVRAILGRALQIYSGQAYDSRYTYWSTGQTMLGESTSEVSVDGENFTRYSCNNGGTLDYRGIGTGSRGGLAHRYIYIDCQIGDVLINGFGAYFEGPGVDNFSPDLIMQFADGSSLEIRGLLERHTEHPTHHSYDFWRGATSIYRMLSADGAVTSIVSSTRYEQSVSCCEDNRRRELSGNIQFMDPLTNSQLITASTTETFSSSSDLGFDLGSMSISAEDGSRFVVNAEQSEYGNNFQIRILDANGSEEWLEDWSDWEPLLGLPSRTLR